MSTNSSQWGTHYTNVYKTLTWHRLLSNIIIFNNNWIKKEKLYITCRFEEFYLHYRSFNPAVHSLSLTWMENYNPCHVVLIFSCTVLHIALEICHVGWAGSRSSCYWKHPSRPKPNHRAALTPLFPLKLSEERKTSQINVLQILHIEEEVCDLGKSWWIFPVALSVLDTSLSFFSPNRSRARHT